MTGAWLVGALVCLVVANDAAYEKACEERDFSGSDNPAAYSPRQHVTPDRAAKNTPKFEELRKHVTPEMNRAARDFLCFLAALRA